MKRTTAPNSVAGLHVDRIAGVQAGTRGIAEDRNNLQEELCHLIESVGWSLDGTDQYQLLRSVIAQRYEVGKVIDLPYKKTPVTVAGSKSTTNPSNPDYWPAIDVTDADHDVPSTQAPDLVTELRAYAATVLGSASFTATVSGSVLTFANTSANNALIRAVLNDALVQRWFSSSQSATFEGSGGDFSGGRCINVAGTDFAITAVSVGSRTITVTGSPTTGSQTVIFYPFRIAGSTTSVRLHRLSGFVPVAAGDSDGVEIAGMRHMDAGQGHYHQPLFGSFMQAVGSGGTNTSSGGTIVQNSSTTAGPITDGTNGTPRTGKTTNPRSHARHTYYWAGRLLT